VSSPDSSPDLSIHDFLPEWLGDYAEAVAIELQVPADAVSTLALGAISAAINGSAQSEVVEGWIEPVNMYTMALLASGEGKSPAFARLLDPVTKAAEEVHGVIKSDVRQQQARNRMHKKYLRSTETSLMKQVKDGDITLDDAIIRLAYEEQQLKTSARSTTGPTLRILTDVTPAAVIDALEANDGRIIVASPEAEALLNFRGGSKEAVLKGYDGERLTQARRTTGEITIERPIVTMMLAMQPTVLTSLGSDMVNRGLMPRFMIAYPDTMVGHRAARPRLVPAGIIKAYTENIASIVEMFASNDIKTITWSPAARRRIGQWRDEIEPQMATDGLLAPISAWASKVRGGHFIRMASILTIADGRTEVTVQDADDAANILRLYTLHALRAFGEMGASSADDLIHLMALVAKLPSDTFSKRDIMRRSNRFMSQPDRAADALSQAVEQGLLLIEGRGWKKP